MIQIPNYTIKNELCKHDTATTYLAEHTESSSPNLFVLKVIHTESARSDAFRSCFLTVGKQLMALEHPHLVKVYDSGITDDNLCYITMEYLAQGSFSEKKLQEPRPIASILTIIENIGSALSYIHNQNVIHGNLKPENILLSSNGVKLTDAGYTELQEVSGDLALLQENFHYMSPEQVTMSKLDQRSDIYSLGLILYEMLVGEKAFSATTTTEAIYQHTMLAPPDLPTKYSYLQSVLDKALTKSPDGRYKTVKEMLQALEISVDAFNINQLVHQIHIKAATDNSPTSSPKRSWTKRGILIGLVFVVGLVSLVFALSSKGKRQAVTTESASLIAIKKEEITNAEDKTKNTNDENHESNNDLDVIIPHAVPTSKISIDILAATDKKPLKASIVIISKDAGEIIVDGKNLGRSEFDLEAGEYKVQVKNKGYYSQSKRLKITDTPHDNVIFNLEKIILTGQLKVWAINKQDTKPLQATYEVRGINNNYHKKQKKRQSSNFKLPLGQYDLIVSYKAKTIKKRITIKQNETLNKKIIFTLPKEKPKPVRTSKPEKKPSENEKDEMVENEKKPNKKSKLPIKEAKKTTNNSTNHHGDNQLSRIYMTAKLGSDQGRRLSADFFLYQNQKLVKKALKKREIQFNVPSGKYIIKVTYKGVSSQASAIIEKGEIIDQVFVYDNIPSLLTQ